ncbi:MAG: PIN domain-containing protein [Candidatus Sungiibacteriota bacterium]
MFTIDTNILIYYAAGDIDILTFFRANQHAVFYLPSIVIAEFLAYPLMTPAVAEKFHNFTRQIIIVNLDYPIARYTAIIRREAKLPLADAAIAASSIITHSTLLTRNIRDFKKVSGLTIFPL